MNIIDLRKEIIFFKEKLNSLSNEDFSWDHTEVLQFEDKKNYPLDFQIFMEEIGTVYASCEFNEGYKILNLELPRAVVKSDFVNPHLFETDSLDRIEINGISVPAHNIRLIATDVDMQFYGFNTSKNPYEFFSMWGVDWAGESTVGISFWSWFKKHMSDSIEYL